MYDIKSVFTTKADGNLAFHVNDNEKNVLLNHKKLAKKHGYNFEQLRYMNQVHGNTIKIVSSKDEQCIKNCDALITNEKNLPLMVMVADCIPILMYDKTQGIVAAIHAGRNSTFLNIAGLTAQKMMEHFACKAQDIHVQLGPSIQKCCYEVSFELTQIVKKSFADAFVNNRLIDLQGINKKQLQDLGITQIETSEICTKCSCEPYFSYRLNKNTGRFAGIISL